MKNQIFSGGPTRTRFALCPTTVKAGDLVLLGTIPAVALNDYSSVTLGSTFYLEGSFSYSVVAKSSLSPSVNAAINPGDALYLDGGTLDSTTNVTTGGTIDVNTGGTKIGQLDPTNAKLTSGTTTTAFVKLLEI